MTAKDLNDNKANNPIDTSEKPNAVEDFFGRMGVLGELFSYLWKQKLYWLIPMVVVLAVFAVIIVLGSNPVTAPFIYSLR